MVKIKKMVLDVLKPHDPGIFKVASDLALLGENYRTKVSVIELDKQTETLRIEITGDSLNFELIASTLKSMGASLHSVDEVEAINEQETR
jgi:hypothetical protein